MSTIAQNEDGIADLKMQNLSLIRGRAYGGKNFFYMIQQDLSSKCDVLTEFQISWENDKWNKSLRSVYSNFSGKVLSLELDHENLDHKTGNQLFVID